MKLGEYLESHSIQQSDFAGRIGVTEETVRRYIVGARVPRPRIMEKIALATGCQVTANDFFGIAA